MQKITPCLWFEGNAEEAVKMYTSIFKNSKILSTSRFDESSSKVSGMPKGSVMVMTFTIEGQEFMALNGGPIFKFSEAISFSISCKTQQEVDFFWETLSKGGSEGPCGWLKDKYEVSWQVSPTILEEMLRDKNPKKSQATMKAMLKMKKIIIKDLQKAYDSAK